MSKKIVVSGAYGKMGQEVVKLVNRVEDFTLVGAVDVNEVGADINQLLGLEGPVIEISDDLAATLDATDPDAVVDFTSPQVVMDNIKTVLNQGIDMVVGTTGITEVDLDQIKGWNQHDSEVIIAPNFAIGAILMMNFAQQAAKFLSDVEIIELHHDEKLDAPSGTAIQTAERVAKNLETSEKTEEEIEKLAGARGGEQDDINIHSVRLPGLVAHQEVIFGGEGQTLHIKHDSINRQSFMPGVELALKKLDEIEGIVYGLEKIMEL